MKRNAFFGLLAILLVFGFVGCSTVSVTFTPTEIFDDPGYVLTGDSVGNFTENDPSFEYKFSLVRGAGDTDNHLFEIKNGNILVAKRSLPPREYSVRIKMLGANQDEGNNGIQNIFTFTVTVEPPPPEPVDFPQGFQGSWLVPGETVGLFAYSSKTLIIDGHNLKADLGRDYKADYVLYGISDDTFTLVNTDENANAYNKEIDVVMKLVNGNIEITSSTSGPGYWTGTYSKQ